MAEFVGEEFTPGCSVWDAAECLVRYASADGSQCRFERTFNGTPIFATPGEDARTVVNRWSEVREKIQTERDAERALLIPAPTNERL